MKRVGIAGTLGLGEDLRLAYRVDHPGAVARRLRSDDVAERCARVVATNGAGRRWRGRRAAGRVTRLTTRLVPRH